MLRLPASDLRSAVMPWRAVLLFLLLELAVVGFAAEHGTFSAVAVLWGVAWLAIGSLPGFLFGVPKVIQRTQEGDGTAYAQLVNTNLEQVSDWLTKILLGIGLVQLTKVGSAVSGAAAVMTAGTTMSTSVASALLVTFACEGFLIGYIATRLLLARAFAQADQALSSEQREELESAALVLPASEEGGASASTSSKAATVAQVVARKPFVELRPTEYFQWGAAQRLLGNTAEAVRALRMAVEVEPSNVRARLEYGIALYAQGKVAAAVDELRRARRDLPARGASALATAVYGWLTYACLFVGTEAGFTEAIDAGEEFLKRYPNDGDGSVLVNLAAAYGQKARHLAGAEKKDPAEVARTNARALEVVKLAARFDRGRWKPRLRELMDPGAAKNPEDNDLEIFHGQEEFRAALQEAA